MAIVRDKGNSLREDQIIFLHEVVKGIADKSYGIHVGKLAGLPLSVVQRAEEILSTLENTKQKPQLASRPLPLFAETYKASSPLEKAMEGLNPDELTPKEALEKLYLLKKILGSYK